MKNAWNWIGSGILRYKFPLLGFILLLTIGLGYKASQIQLSYELAKILPKTDERFQLYEGFKKKYGEDGAVMVIAVENPQIFTPTEFQAWRDLTKEVKKQAGIKNEQRVAAQWFHGHDVQVGRNHQVANEFVVFLYLDRAD